MEQPPDCGCLRLFKPKSASQPVDLRKSMARKPNFTSQELNVLVDEVEKRRLVLFSKLKNSVTNAEKKEAWQEVAEHVNSVGLGYRRDGANLRNKWRDYSSVVKCKAAALRREQQKTGAGRTTVPDLTPLEERVLGVLGQEAVEGVPGGIDVCAMRRMPQTPSGPWQCEASASSALPHPSQPPALSGEPPALSVLPHSPPPCHPPNVAMASPLPQSRGSLTETAASPLYARASGPPVRLREKVAVLRGIQEELAALREQNQRHHEDVMAYRSEKLAMLSQQANRAGANPEVLRAMAALQRIIELNRRRRRRSDVVYVHAYIRQNFNPLEVLSEDAVVRKYRLTRPQIRELLQLMQLLAALRFYASGSFFAVLGDGLGMSKASISRSVTLSRRCCCSWLIGWPFHQPRMTSPGPPRASTVSPVFPGALAS
ncbi:hypothetical protein ACEWY4_025553 [Coilia grayii]|uniref:Myb-like domain-containing protein n=1 Tax=Coilia grayii TaxID=363190 RepID=A0ABD1IYW0_9TELE